MASRKRELRPVLHMPDVGKRAPSSVPTQSLCCTHTTTCSGTLLVHAHVLLGPLVQHPYICATCAHLHSLGTFAHPQRTHTPSALPRTLGPFFAHLAHPSLAHVLPPLPFRSPAEPTRPRLCLSGGLGASAPRPDCSCSAAAGHPPPTPGGRAACSAPAAAAHGAARACRKRSASLPSAAHALGCGFQRTSGYALLITSQGAT